MPEVENIQSKDLRLKNRYLENTGTILRLTDKQLLNNRFLNYLRLGTEKK